MDPPTKGPKTGSDGREAKESLQEDQRAEDQPKSSGSSAFDALQKRISEAASQLQPTALVGLGPEEPQPGASNVPAEEGVGAQPEAAPIAPRVSSLWAHQPMMQIGETPEINEPIMKDVSSFLGATPSELPIGMVWCYTLPRESEITQSMINDLSFLLRDHYVTDDSSTFQLEYTPGQISWVLKQGSDEDKAIVVGVKICDPHPDDLIGDGQLIASVVAIPARISVYGKKIKVGLINFLCVHKLFRERRITPLLVGELMRRLAESGIYQATFTTSTDLPLQPVAACRYSHFPINVMKLGEQGFIDTDQKDYFYNKAICRWVSEGKMQLNFQPLSTANVNQAFVLVNEYLKKYAIKQIFDLAQFSKVFGNQKDVVRTFVIEKSGVVTDLISYYIVYLKKVGVEKARRKIKCACALLNIGTTVPLADVWKHTILLAKGSGCDVFNVLNIMQNSDVLGEVEFLEGTGSLGYFLYNWRCPPINPNQVGLVLP